MNKILMLLVVVSTVIGITAPAMANPEIDSNAIAKNWKTISVFVEAEQTSNNNIDQYLNNYGDQENNNANVALGGYANANSIALGAATAGNNDSLLTCNNGGDGKGKGNGTGAGTGNGGVGGNGGNNNSDNLGNTANGGAADGVGVGVGVGIGHGMGGNGGNGCDNSAFSEVEAGDAYATGGDASNYGDVYQKNKVYQDANAVIFNDQNLEIPIFIEEYQEAHATESSKMNITDSLFDEPNFTKIVTRENN